MSEELMYQKLVKICDSKNISNNTETLKSYTKDLSFFPEKTPKCVV